MSDTDYIQEQEFRDYIKSQGTSSSDSINYAITAASRAVDAYCGRVFYTQAGTFYYSSCPDDQDAYWSLEIDDLSTTSGLVVKTDDNTGTYATTLTVNTDFIVEPVNQTFGGLSGWPYTSLRALSPLKFPLRYYQWERDKVQITGTWGWPDVPEPVRQATKIMAAQFYKLGEAPLGVAGFGSYGDIRVRDIPQAAALLMPYRKAESYGVA